MLNKYETAHQWLQGDPLRHLVHLKYLHLYGAQMEVYSYANDGSYAVMLMHLPELTSWDRRLYPTARRVLLPTASDHTAAAHLRDYAFNHFPRREPLVFKFCDETTHRAFAAAFPLRLTRTLISYTAQREQTFTAWSDVTISRTPDEACIALYRANGYLRPEIDKAFAEGAQSFAIYEVDVPICACFVYRNFENIWEIAAVRTVEGAQRRGLARRVVQTALHTLIEQGYIPRYQVESENLASIRLAESLGLISCLHFEHYLRG